MKIFEDIPLSEFNWWAGATDRANKLTDEQMQELEQYLEEQYPDGMDATELNDLMWNYFDEVCDILGIDEESLYENKSMKKKNLKEISSGMLYRAAGKAERFGRDYQSRNFRTEAGARDSHDFDLKYSRVGGADNLAIELDGVGYNSHLEISYTNDLNKPVNIRIEYGFSSGLDIDVESHEVYGVNKRKMSEEAFSKFLGTQKTSVRRTILNAMNDFKSVISNYKDNYNKKDEEENAELNENSTKKITKKQLQEMVRKCAVKVLNEAMKNSK